jgi:hypothetical protein
MGHTLKFFLQCGKRAKFALASSDFMSSEQMKSQIRGLHHNADVTTHSLPDRDRSLLHLQAHGTSERL